MRQHTPEDIGFSLMELDYLLYKVDFAIWVQTVYDGLPDNTLVSLIVEPQRRLEAAVDQFLEINGRQFLRDFGYEKPEELSEEYVREKAELELGGKRRRVIMQSCVCSWLKFELRIFGGAEDKKLPLKKVMGALTKSIEESVDKINFYLGQDSPFGGRRNLAPSGDTLVEKYRDYNNTWEMLISSMNQLLGEAQKHPHYEELEEKPKRPWHGMIPTPIPDKKLLGKEVELVEDEKDLRWVASDAPKTTWPDPKKHTILHAHIVNDRLRIKVKTDGSVDGRAEFRLSGTRNKQGRLMQLLISEWPKTFTCDEIIEQVYNDRPAKIGVDVHLQLSKVRSLVKGIRDKLEKSGINPDILSPLKPYATGKDFIELRLSKKPLDHDKRKDPGDITATLD